MGVRGIAASGVFAVGFLSVAVALQCYHCGMYNDGVGSITPCLNETHMKLMECPHRENNFCIALQAKFLLRIDNKSAVLLFQKYINEGSTVRDCVPKCIEKGCETSSGIPRRMEERRGAAGGAKMQRTSTE
ncbi:hypothetical protein NQ315_011693 [Exocentrus adspersus]|uniref:Secreted protein n=1 Tax=Exocentrus adspersus TaxID=1586481 RepID=A0AAV8W0L0_9CUCU|nr:hypothetical protein NQ315_011693 [Exocentrus adspersus]